MRNVALGSTGIVTVQDAFGALPIQRISDADAVSLVRRAFEGGMRFFDTARAYSDSEEKLGYALDGIRDEVWIATKTQATTPEAFWCDLESSLAALRTDHVDVYQFHNAQRCYRPGDGTGMYECMLEAKAQGKIGHIALTAHRIGVAEEAVESGLYETLQFPFSYLSGPREIGLYEKTVAAGMGFIAMKGLAGGLIGRSDVAMAFMDAHPGALPIWGIQRASELEEWLGYLQDTPKLDEEHRAFIEHEKRELAGEFCRGCGYCMPCPAGISIKDCARMSLMIRRAPARGWLSERWQHEMDKIETCTGCRACEARCPYDLPTPELLQRNLVDYRRVLAGEVSVQ